ncbi:MAG TPA: methylated-DNA--[protein]-cysteine S-methyltransferase [Jiangellaceae bacterium]|nr:methylated-DNA--[protein]-cysteine S-methyltransferase [Jiangellaceae bacterium]
MPTYWTSVGSPLGPLLLTADDEGLTGLHMDSGRYGPAAPKAGWVEDAALLADVAGQLDEYFAGDRTEFDVPLHPSGTPFQLEVWQALTTIPYGEVRSYGQIADQLGHPGASRAVGLANGRNPIAVIVPCHRVVGASGSLTGYGGGLERKRLLLDLEASVAGTTLLAAAPTSVSRSGES